MHSEEDEDVGWVGDKVHFASPNMTVLFESLTMRICYLQNNLSGHCFKNYSVIFEYFKTSHSSLVLA